ncbi:MAG TPA: 23S rRNA (guanosine(2251)-2'-O)-methyltransferase RlmB [Chloroflexota bacterium]|nr:23S rRNA (guanosine(2251)-2'-O)-methyltransferase RlmB [Chloroflexota bacterium]
MVRIEADVYGRRPVLEALRAGHVARIYLAREARDASILRELHESAHAAGVRIEIVPRADLDRALPNRNHQGIAAAHHQFAYVDLDEILRVAGEVREPGLILALDGVQDVGNLGSLLRSADGAGVHGVVLPRHRAAGVTPAVVRASAGAAEHLAIALETNLTRTLRELKRAGYWAIGLDEEGTLPYHALDADRPLVLVVGGEEKGLTRLVRETCDQVVRLPMYGRVASLNAAVAGAIVLYEVRRQRDLGRRPSPEQASDEERI